MSKKPEAITPAFASIRIERVDTYSFRLIHCINGKETIIMQETFGLVQDRAELILRQMAEGSYSNEG